MNEVLIITLSCGRCNDPTQNAIKLDDIRSKNQNKRMVCGNCHKVLLYLRVGDESSIRKID